MPETKSYSFERQKLKVILFIVCGLAAILVVEISHFYWQMSKFMFIKNQKLFYLLFVISMKELHDMLN